MPVGRFRALLLGAGNRPIGADPLEEGMLFKRALPAMGIDM